MKIGKIPAKKLEELVLNKLSPRRKEVLVRASIGEDSAVLDLENDLLVISSDPITGAEKNAAYLAVHVSCNDLAAAGAEPVGIQVILLLPPELGERELAELMQAIEATAQEVGVEVLGGHTEIVSVVNKPLIIITALGRAARGAYVTTAGAKIGDELVLTKGLGIEGTYILAHDYAELLLEKGVQPEVISRAREYYRMLSVIKEGRLGVAAGVHAMHDVTEGGLYGGLEELAQAAGVGFEIYQEALPVRKETELICQALNLDPGALISSGSMLMSIPDADVLIKLLATEGIAAYRIGRIIPEGQYIVQGNKRREFVWQKKDELWRFMELIS